MHAYPFPKILADQIFNLTGKCSLHVRRQPRRARAASSAETSRRAPLRASNTFESTSLSMKDLLIVVNERVKDKNHGMRGLF